jgi:hypothetical protein
MILTTYTIGTPAGVFQANWDEDEEIAVSYTGEPDAIAFFRAYLDLASPSARGGALVQFDTLEPEDFGFIAVENAPIVVLDPQEQLEPDEEPDDEPDMQPDTKLVLDSANDADTFALIGEGAQLLAGLNEDADSFFDDLSRLREIIAALGDAAAVTPEPVEPVDPIIEPVAVITPEPAPVVEPAPTPDPAPVKVDFADLLIPSQRTIKALREIDIYRVLVAAPEDQRAAFAQWIIEARPDLADEVQRVMREEWPGDAPTDGTVTPPTEDRTVAVTDPLPEEGAEVPPAVGEVTESTPERDADMAFLRAVTAGEIDVWENDPADRIEAIVGTYAADEAVLALAREAIDAYINTTSQVLQNA